MVGQTLQNDIRCPYFETQKYTNTKRERVSIFWQTSIVLKIGRSYDVFEHIVRYCARLKLEHRHCNENHFNITIVLISYGDALAPRLDVSV